MFELAAKLDPEFALAHSQLSIAHSALFFYGFDRTPPRLALSRSSADRGLALQPDLAEAHVAMGQYWYRGHRDWAKAEN